ncbi:methyltransferase [Thermosulfurimonas sp.]|uniref:tRNA1(Val) (adenine(37)-N6)-methyltransferase n=1 Tax=Thermosulfurimonas sp. TaxID=2080236 RepID=UPI0025D22114|nr:methyltransferase [Thermosulfurimonas sp.]
MKPYFSRDVLFKGRLTVYQPRRGYRFSVESLLLAEFVRLRGRERLVDLGAGCGVISAVLALRYPGIRIWALEIQEILCRALRLTIRENALSGRVLPLRGDIRRPPLRPGLFEAVVANPPFKPPHSGRLPPEESHLLARTETLATLSDFLRAARYLLKTGGRFFLIHTAHRAVEVLCGLREFGLEPKRLRWVHPRPGDEARFLLVEAIKGAAPEVRVDPPLFISSSAFGKPDSDP